MCATTYFCDLNVISIKDHLVYYGKKNDTQGTEANQSQEAGKEGTENKDANGNAPNADVAASSSGGGNNAGEGGANGNAGDGNANGGDANANAHQDSRGTGTTGDDSQDYLPPDTPEFVSLQSWKEGSSNAGTQSGIVKHGRSKNGHFEDFTLVVQRYGPQDRWGLAFDIEGGVVVGEGYESGNKHFDENLQKTRTKLKDVQNLKTIFIT
jgi:hypothetical protein